MSDTNKPAQLQNLIGCLNTLTVVLSWQKKGADQPGRSDLCLCFSNLQKSCYSHDMA